jgi:hypothetical protein
MPKPVLVKCLMAAPSKIPPGLAPGAKSRYDDFVVTHVNQTLTIHFTGSFFAWHRYYIWSFERALRQECDYDGYLPYWNWGKSAQVSAGLLLFKIHSFCLPQRHHIRRPLANLNEPCAAHRTR